MSNLKLKDLTIHPMLEKALPPLTEKKYQEVRSLIERNGYDKDCPIRVWVDCVEYPNCIVDGHHRYKICQELGIEPEIKECSYPSLVHAKDAVLRTAAGRQMDASQAAQHIVDLELSQAELEAWERQHSGENQYSLVAPVPQAPDDNDSEKRAPPVRKILADHANVGEKTVGSIIQVRKKLVSEPNLAEEIQDMIRNGELQAKPAGEFVAFPIEVIKDVIKGGASAIKAFLSEQHAITRKKKEAEKQAKEKELAEYKESQKELQKIHDEKVEEVKRQYGSDYENIGRVCIVDHGNTYEKWCNDCLYGFDTFIGGPETKHCPYCGEKNITDRIKDWIPNSIRS